ncbi:MAG: hypothetical protein GXP47_06765 [Acidobacteria bacterium]|nr:hypothetical protein [Acidobacteriota bacterium]
MADELIATGDEHGGGDGLPPIHEEDPRAKAKLRRLVLGTVVIAVILVLAFWAFLKVGTDPSFYARFPWLTEYVASWKASTHADVPCAACHFEPGAEGAVRAQKVAIALVTERMTDTGSTTAFHSAPEAGCTRDGCHADVLTGGAIQWRGVRFSHADHLGKIKRGLKPACTTCHQSLVHGTGKKPVSTAACAICHFRKLGWEENISRCQLCHDVTKLPKDRYDHTLVAKEKMKCIGCHADVNKGVGDVDRDRCVVCHTAGDRAEKYGNVKLVHRVHVDEQGFACTFCHHPIEHKVHPLSVASDTDCANCHRDTHTATRSLYLGVSAADPGAKPAPDAMAKVHVHCEGCHTAAKALGDGEVQLGSGKACDDCHGPGYDRILRAWKGMLRRDLAAARRAVTAARSAVRGQRVPRSAREQVALAQKRLRQVEVGHGVHNVVFAAVQLDDAVRASNAALKAAGSRTRFPRIADAKRLTANECARCHTTIAKTVTWQGVPFPHAKHAGVVGDCTSCHTPYSDHGKMSWGKKACGSCHTDVPLPHPKSFRSTMGQLVKKVGFKTCLACHGGRESREKCTPCHEGGPKKEILWKGMALSHANHAKHDIDCTTCHTELSRHGGVALTPAECNECHGVTMPHPDDFAETHGQLFLEHKLELDTCSTCHEGGMPGEFCQTCHG